MTFVWERMASLWPWDWLAMEFCFCMESDLEIFLYKICSFDQVCCLCFHHCCWLSRWKSSCFTLWRVYWWFTIGTSWSRSTASSGSRRGSMNWTAESCTLEAQKYVRQWKDLHYSDSSGQGRRGSWWLNFHEVHFDVDENFIFISMFQCSCTLVRHCW